jgi:hypothetical protein
VHVFVVVSQRLEELRDMVVVQAVEGMSAIATNGHQTALAEQS